MALPRASLVEFPLVVPLPAGLGHFGPDLPAGGNFAQRNRCDSRIPTPPRQAPYSSSNPMKHLRSLFLIAALVVPAVGQTFSVTSIENPSGPGSLQPNWSATPDGAAVLSWIEQ